MSKENIQQEPVEEVKSNVRKITHPPKLRIIPPLNFCPVEKQLYRSGQPSIINQSFLNQLNLKTIIWLASEEPSDDFLEYCNYNQINIEFIGMINEFEYSDQIQQLQNPWDSLNDKTIKKALEVIVNKQNYPILISCGMGRHRTGTIVGCLRRIQKWNYSSISDEYRRFCNQKGRILVELLIEEFDIESVNIDLNDAPDFYVKG